MTTTDSTNYQNTMRRVIYGYIYTLTIKIHIKEKTWNCFVPIVITEKFAKIGGKRFEFIMKRMYSLVNVENY